MEHLQRGARNEATMNTQLGEGSKSEHPIPPPNKLMTAFHSYAKVAYDQRVSEDSVQYRELQRAFVAGASAMFYQFMKIADMDEDSGMAEVKTYDTALQDFRDRVSSGSA